MLTPNTYCISKREQEVLRALALGKKSKEIALDLGLSIHTINNHRKSILHKTGCANATEVVLWAVRNGILLAQ